jgi:hypothetical protein
MKARMPALLSELLVALCIATCSYGDTLTEAMRKEDPRLEQRVILSAPRVYSGELLERLSALTGVSLSAGERDGAADAQLSVFLRDVPLADALDALWSLLSYRDAGWHWEREGEKGGFAYRLIRPLAAQQLAARLEQQLQANFEDEAAIKQAYLGLTPEQLAEKARQDPKARTLVEFPRTREGLRTFSETLSPEMQQRVLRRQDVITIPVNQLSEQGRAFVKMVWSEGEHFQINPVDGSRTPTPEPDSITFFTEQSNGMITPVLAIDIPGAGAHGYLGGRPLEMAYLRKLDDLWMLPGDKSKDPQTGKPIPAPGKQTAPEEIHSLPQRFQQVAEAVPLSLMARLPGRTRLSGGLDPGAPYRQTVEAFLQRLNQGLLLIQSKWRNGTLLLTYPSWFHEEALTVPWALVKKLRQAEKAGGGLLSLDDLAQTAAQLDVPRLQRLAEEFPVMNNVAYQRDLFALMALSPGVASRLRSKQGVPLAEIQPALASIRGFMRPGEVPGGSAVVRLEVRERAVGREITFYVLSADGKVVSRMVFIYAAHFPEQATRTP